MTFNWFVLILSIIRISSSWFKLTCKAGKASTITNYFDARRLSNETIYLSKQKVEVVIEIRNTCTYSHIHDSVL